MLNGSTSATSPRRATSPPEPSLLRRVADSLVAILHRASLRGLRPTPRAARRSVPSAPVLARRRLHPSTLLRAVRRSARDLARPRQCADRPCARGAGDGRPRLSRRGPSARTTALCARFCTRSSTAGANRCARPLGALMADAPGELFDGIDMVVPVPLHWRRRRQRGFNQARGVGAGSGPAVAQRAQANTPHAVTNRPSSRATPC